MPLKSAPDPGDPPTVGTILRTARERRGWTTWQFAHISETDRRHLQRIESGQRALTPRLAERLAWVLAPRDPGPLQAQLLAAAGRAPDGTP